MNSFEDDSSRYLNLNNCEGQPGHFYIDLIGPKKNLKISFSAPVVVLIEHNLGVPEGENFVFHEKRHASSVADP